MYSVRTEPTYGGEDFSDGLRRKTWQDICSLGLKSIFWLTTKGYVLMGL